MHTFGWPNAIIILVTPPIHYIVLLHPISNKNTFSKKMTGRWSSFFVFFSNYFIDSFKFKSSSRETWHVILVSVSWDKIYIILTNLLLYPPKTIYFYIYIKNRKPEMIYSIESDDRANKNAEQDFLCCAKFYILCCISFLAVVSFLQKKYFYKYKIGVFCWIL